VELHLFKTAVPLLLILHVKDLDELERDHSFVLHTLSLEYVGELALANQFLNLEAVDDHAHVQHHIVRRVRLLIRLLRRHLGFRYNITARSNKV
jgi:hypothetical protein